MTRSESVKQQIETQGVQEDSSIELADTFFAKLAGLEKATLGRLLFVNRSKITLASARD